MVNPAATPGLARNLTYRTQRLCIRFAALAEKITDVAQCDRLDNLLGELEQEIDQIKRPVP